mmetsp:Transcript_39231/g.90367  ORF Transcript_39231/g.90367 Transcript_39231/m.90367 type:complete len:204 (+) Transcript_39231:221-832(+)
MTTAAREKRSTVSLYLCPDKIRGMNSHATSGRKDLSSCTTFSTMPSSAPSPSTRRTDESLRLTYNTSRLWCAPGALAPVSAAFSARASRARLKLCTLCRATSSVKSTVCLWNSWIIEVGRVSPVPASTCILAALSWARCRQSMVAILGLDTSSTVPGTYTILEAGTESRGTSCRYMNVSGTSSGAVGRALASKSSVPMPSFTK